MEWKTPRHAAFKHKAACRVQCRTLHDAAHRCCDSPQRCPSEQGRTGVTAAFVRPSHETTQASASQQGQKYSPKYSAEDPGVSGAQPRYSLETLQPFNGFIYVKLCLRFDIFRWDSPIIDMPHDKEIHAT